MEENKVIFEVETEKRMKRAIKLGVKIIMALASLFYLVMIGWAIVTIKERGFMDVMRILLISMAYIVVNIIGIRQRLYR